MLVLAPARGPILDPYRFGDDGILKIVGLVAIVDRDRCAAAGAAGESLVADVIVTVKGDVAGQMQIDRTSFSREHDAALRRRSAHARGHIDKAVGGRIDLEGLAGPQRIETHRAMSGSSSMRLDHDDASDFGGHA